MDHIIVYFRLEPNILQNQYLPMPHPLVWLFAVLSQG
jgi:hypothetical protein